MASLALLPRHRRLWRGVEYPVYNVYPVDDEKMSKHRALRIREKLATKRGMEKSTVALEQALLLSTGYTFSLSSTAISPEEICGKSKRWKSVSGVSDGTEVNEELGTLRHMELSCQKWINGRVLQNVFRFTYFATPTSKSRLLGSFLTERSLLLSLRWCLG